VIKFDKNSWFIYSILGFLAVLNLAIVIGIPIILQISGLMALCFVPGYLLCLVFGIRVTGWVENFLYAMGMSITFDLFFGLSLNTILAVFGDTKPLSLINLQIWYSVIVLILTALIFYTDNVPTITLTLPKLRNIEKILLILGLIILGGVETGIHLINTNGTNLVLIFSVLLIPLILLICIIYHDDTIKRTYPYLIFLISTSLVLMLALRSNYIIGVDTHEEYYLFMTTLIHSIWIPDPTSILSASLSISIVPAIFENFLGTDPQLLFKILYPLIFSVIPVVIYVIAKKYVSELTALFASCYFMFQNIFILTSYNSRTSMGIFFFAFAILVLCDTELLNWKKNLFFMLFITGTVLSHYTTALIFLGLLILAYILDLILAGYRDRKKNRFIGPAHIFYFAGLVFFWYQQIIAGVFSTGIFATLLRVTIFSDLLNAGASKYVYSSFRYSSFLWNFTRFTQVIIFSLMGLGILFMLYSVIRKKRWGNSVPFLGIEVDRFLFSMGIIAVGILFAVVVAPFLFFGYDTGRTKEVIDIILPLFLIIGVCNLFYILVWRRENVNSAGMQFSQKAHSRFYREKTVSVVLLFLLIPSLLLASGISFEMDGLPYSIILNSPQNAITDTGRSYISDQDAHALQWFKTHSLQNPNIWGDDYGNHMITSVVVPEPKFYQESVVQSSEGDLLYNHIFLNVMDGYTDEFKDLSGKELPIWSLERILSQKNKIFSNGASVY
jgi:uncharacterized membrane protein